MRGRRARPAPADAKRLGAGREPVAPRTDAERALTDALAKLLRVDRVGVHDNFFALGGDSILAIQFVTRARSLGFELSTRQLFEHPTIAQLAVRTGSVPTTTAEQGPVTGPV